MSQILCPRCTDVGENILSAQRVNKLCTECGNALIQIDDVLVERPEVEAEAPEPEKPKPDDGLPTMEEIDNLQVKVLRPLAKKLGIEGWWNKRQGKLIKEIKAFLSK